MMTNEMMMNVMVEEMDVEANGEANGEQRAALLAPQVAPEVVRAPVSANKMAKETKHKFLDKSLKPRLGAGGDVPLHRNAAVRDFQRRADVALKVMQRRGRDRVESRVAGMPESNRAELDAKWNAAVAAWDEECEAVILGAMGSGKTLCASILAALFDVREQYVRADHEPVPGSGNVVGERFARMWKRAQHSRVLHLNRGKKDCKNFGNEGLEQGFREGGGRDVKDCGLVRAVGMRKSQVHKLAERTYLVEPDHEPFRRTLFEQSWCSVMTIQTCAQQIRNGNITPEDVGLNIFEEGDISGQDGTQETTELSWNNVTERLSQHALSIYVTGTPSGRLQELPPLVQCTYGDLFRERSACALHLYDIMVEGMMHNGARIDVASTGVIAGSAVDRERFKKVLRDQEASVKAYLRTLVSTLLRWHDPTQPGSAGLPFQMLLLVPKVGTPRARDEAQARAQAVARRSMVSKITEWVNEVIDQGCPGQFEASQRSGCWNRPLVAVGITGKDRNAAQILEGYERGEIDILIGDDLIRRNMNNPWLKMVFNLREHKHMPAYVPQGAQTAGYRERVREAIASRNDMLQGLLRGGRPLAKRHAQQLFTPVGQPHGVATRPRAQFAQRLDAYLERYTYHQLTNPNAPRQPTHVFELASNENRPILAAALQEQGAAAALVNAGEMPVLVQPPAAGDTDDESEAGDESAGEAMDDSEDDDSLMSEGEGEELEGEGEGEGEEDEGESEGEGEEESASESGGEEGEEPPPVDEGEESPLGPAVQRQRTGRSTAAVTRRANANARAEEERARARGGASAR